MKRKRVSARALLIVVLFAIATACDSGLSEREARRVIDEDGLTNGRAINRIGLKRSKLMETGAIWRLTHTDKCWAQVLYAQSSIFTSVDSRRIAPTCPDVDSADLFWDTGDHVWYAQAIKIATYRPEVDQIHEILTRDGTAKVTYTVKWVETDLFRQWRSEDPALRKKPPKPEKREACLYKHDQGWRMCNRD